MSARDYGDVPEYPAQSGTSLDDRGYLLSIDTNGRVGKLSASASTTSNLFAANYKSTNDQDGNTQSLSQDDSLACVRHSPGFPLRASARDWTAGEKAEVHSANDGEVDNGTGNATVGLVVEDNDLSGESNDGDGEVLVSFDFAHTGE